MKPLAPRWYVLIALLVSALLHGWLLWQMPLALPEEPTELPLLQAKLETLPAPPPVATKKPSGKPSARHSPAAQSVPTAPERASSEVADSAPGAAQSESAPEEALPPVAEAPVPAPNPALAVAPPPLPKHAQLKFTVRLSDEGVTVGEARHRLDIANGQYQLSATIRTIGLASLFKTVLYNQQSRGRVSDAQGFQPDYAQEDKNVDHVSQLAEMFFEPDAGRVRFSLGGEAALTADTQDRLSLLYQLSRLNLSADTLPLAVTNGRKVEHYAVEIGQPEQIFTPMGKLLTVPVRKIHAAGEEGLEIWLALEYRLLPVKVRRQNRQGEVDGFMVIKEIRLTDE